MDTVEFERQLHEEMLKTAEWYIAAPNIAQHRKTGIQIVANSNGSILDNNGNILVNIGPRAVNFVERLTKEEHDAILENKITAGKQWLKDFLGFGPDADTARAQQQISEFNKLGNKALRR